jgi:pSer/pThr/pTyr-binding forkhead associated (FHA) protein
VAEIETEQLIVKRGPKVGRQFKLSASPTRIGAERSCEVAVKGSYVDPVHAVLERRGNLWYIENKSVNGTLVNQAQITSKVLEPGDVIQIGSETLLAFELIEQKEKKKRREKKPAGAKKGGLFGNPLVVGGVGLYLGAMLIGFIYFSLWSSSTGAGFSAEYAAQVVAETRAFLESDALVSAPTAVEAGALGRLDDASEPAADYYRLLAAQRAGGRAEESSERVKAIEDRIGEEFAQAWLLEQQERWSEAIGRYRQITAIVPDGRAPSTQVAASRIEKLQAKLYQ